MVYDLKKEDGCAHPFDKHAKMAGGNWTRNLFSRHKDMGLRTHEAATGAGAVEFNNVSSEQFFNCLSSIIVEYKLVASTICNYGEVGPSVVPKQSKIISTKGTTVTVTIFPGIKNNVHLNKIYSKVVGRRSMNLNGWPEKHFTDGGKNGDNFRMLNKE